MDKKLLSMAVAAALAGSMGFAQADTTLYGNVNLSIDNFDVDSGDSDTNMNSNTSAIGLKGSEDLGNGLSAIYQAEFQYNAAFSSGFSGRDQWVGLKTKNLGKVRFGTISTVYKSYGAKVDPIYRTSLQGRNHGLQSQLHRGKGENGQGRMTRHIRYDSPSWAGFGLTADYSLDQTDPDASDDNAYAGGVNYKNSGILDGIWVGAAYITSDKGGDDDAWKLGGKLNWSNFGLYGQYESDGGLISNPIDGGNVDVTGSGGTDGQDTWMVGVSYKWGNTLIYGAYADAEDADSSVGLANSGGLAGLDSGYTAWTVAVDHKLSKRTDVYLGYNNLDCNNYVGSVCGGANINGSTPAATQDGTQDFFSVGLRHKF